MTKPIKTFSVCLLAAAVGLSVLGLSSVSRADQSTDQRHRDLTRVLSEVVHRAHSQAQLGHVIRPEFSNPTISLSAPDLHDGWIPSCATEVEATPSNPSRNLQSLVLVPRDRVANDGSSFEAFAFIANDFALTDADMVPPYPNWLTNEVGGYASLDRDIETLFGDLTITVQTTACDGFSFYSISGERP
ncbi:hypothetical protein K3728_17765 [Rhodobacteraceae bacterium M385]|nr:hypothetical protein K3728_17765 [Rhodobacteraceae bacterium M385]